MNRQAIAAKCSPARKYEGLAIALAIGMSEDTSTTQRALLSLCFGVRTKGRLPRPIASIHAAELVQTKANFTVAEVAMLPSPAFSRRDDLAVI